MLGVQRPQDPGVHRRIPPEDIRFRFQHLGSSDRNDHGADLESSREDHRPVLASADQLLPPVLFIQVGGGCPGHTDIPTYRENLQLLFNFSKNSRLQTR